MRRRVVGRIGREQNRDMNREHLDNKGPKTSTGARVTKPQLIQEPPYQGVGRVFLDDDL